MPVLKFRIYWEEEESIYRDILILSGQTFLLFHQAVLNAFGFDQKHKATFFRSNDNWQRGREILLEKDRQPRKADPLLMSKTTIAEAVRDPGQKFVYLYDYEKQWTFLIELIAVTREENHKTDYPLCIKKEGAAPSQYGNKKHVKDQMVETEEQYDLNNDDADTGYGEEGDELPPDNETDGPEEFY